LVTLVNAEGDRNFFRWSDESKFVVLF
jgi:hypothetical protein